MKSFFTAALAAPLAAATILWDGRFNDLTASTDLNKWSFSSEVGPYQYYIHGSSPVTSYVNFDPSYKNPADTGSSKGVKITLDSTAYWNGQTMRRTELIPQTTAAINSGHVYYHFSMKRSATNAPSIYREHQINFFESHFTEMKAGWISGQAGDSNANLQWMVSGTSQWSTPFTADVWHNVAYDIDFSKNVVGFWHSTGSDPLVQVIAPVSASTSSNGADWHLGVLELPRSGYTDANEDLYFSGVYIESGTLTTSVAGPGGAAAAPAPAPASSSAAGSAPAPTTTAAPVPAPAPTTSAAPAPVSSQPAANCAAKYGQCGGIGWSGATCCASGSTCKASGSYYSQCL